MGSGAGKFAGRMRKNGLDLRMLLSLLVLVLVAGAAALVAIGGSAHAKALRAQALAHHFDASAVLQPPRQAPSLQLRNYLGQKVNIDSYRGKAVLVTFLYTNCPDICPLIASNLGVAQTLMSKATKSKVQMIAVSVDPRNDTPKAVAAFLASHGLTGKMQYLIGSRKELAPVWEAWGVGSSREIEQPQFINHTGLVYGITGSGKKLTIYSPEFKPSEIVHDVPLLAAD
jgi:protein SCO1